ncbi:hypothetical protein PPSIR1_17280 [Plesiocystis pacifica SIR-1]|uniref:Amine oxidase domain-containing protein n=2 Tax=Plesiocystis pacifica TaxID=191768 RepID=A6GA21_9BACT|nr:hypothetical protein PPSIR1_17280 [Plesiocystis pacifica SIR-1]
MAAAAWPGRSCAGPALARAGGELMAPRKIAILGGGLGAVSTAYALTSIPGWAERFEIDLYTAGWRLGGKGASGRNAAHAERIEEHGLHVWLGFYQNAFALIQHCYAELGSVAARRGEGPVLQFEDAFRRHSELAVMDRGASGWRRMRLRFPETKAVPGGPNPRLLPSLSHYLELAKQLARTGLESASEDAPGARAQLRRLGRSLQRSVLGRGAWAKARAATDPWTEALDEDPALRETFQLVDLFVTLGLGLVAELGLEGRHLDDLDDDEFLDWLRRWGADPATLDSPLIRGIYDMGLAFEEGDPERPSFAAGAFIRATLRILFTYEGAVFWKMQGGMGDIVFAPLYRVLLDRGVRVHFFHRVDRLEPSADGREVAAVHMSVQAQIRPPSDEQARPWADAEGYDPLRVVHGEPCWPSEPDWGQLADGEALREHLRWLEDPRLPGPAPLRQLSLTRGRDFDALVLGIPVAALRTIAAELGQVNQRFGRMLAGIQTVQTQAAQLWLEPSLDELGYHDPPTVLASYVDPLNTWADMSHLIPLERWSPGEVGSVAYYCGPRRGPEASEAASAAEEQASVEAELDALLDAKARDLWPGAQAEDGRFDSQRLLPDSERARRSYVRVNDAPSERYVLTSPGTTRLRLAPDDSGFANLYLCGDWTRNDFNTGCVEATVMSGLEAARALAAYPFHVVGSRPGRWSSRRSLWERGARS